MPLLMASERREVLRSKVVSQGIARALVRPNRERLGVRLLLVLAAGAALAAAAPAVAAQHIGSDALPEHDSQIFSLSRFQIDAARVDGAFVGSWAGEGWVGNDFDRLWWNTEGERVGGTVADAQLSAMYGHYISPYWDFVVGYRRDFRPVGVNYLTAGIRGLAPYWFDVDARLSLSDRGKLSATTEVATDLLLTQRLITRPEFEFDWPLMSDPVRGLRPGLGDASVGIATRYEFRREFAPYVDIRWGRRAGDSQTGEPASEHDVTGWTIRGGLWLIF